MGGHGHHSNIVIPSPDKYKIEDVPELLKLQEKLAAKGLKDPWLRNEVWRYTGIPGNTSRNKLNSLLRGYKLGIPAFLLSLAYEKYFGTSDGHDHHKEGHH